MIEKIRFKKKGEELKLNIAQPKQIQRFPLN